MRSPLSPWNMPPIFSKRLRGSTVPLSWNRAASSLGMQGILVTKVLYTKENEAKKFVIVDAGMNDLVRPSYYGSFHQILPVRQESREEIIADVVGPICESSDFLAKDRKIQRLHSGELVAVMSAGAYGFSMSTNYNSRRKGCRGPRPRRPDVCHPSEGEL